MKINKKLIEVFKIIIILGIICVIIVPIFTIALKNSNQKLYDIQIKMIEKKAEKWGIDNIEKLSETNTVYLKLNQLINEKYIEQTELRDPRDTRYLLNGCILIEYEKTYRKYKYNYIEKDCEDFNP